MKELPGVTWLVRGGVRIPTPTGLAPGSEPAPRGHTASHSCCGTSGTRQEQPLQLLPLFGGPVPLRCMASLLQARSGFKKTSARSPPPSPPTGCQELVDQRAAGLGETLVHASLRQQLPEAGSGHLVSPLQRTNTALVPRRTQSLHQSFCELALPRGP